jgi:hypothetical protein
MDKLVFTAAQWQGGSTLDQFLAGMTHKQADMRRRLDEVTLTPDEKGRLAHLDGIRHVLVMTEDWCGDSLMVLPILARIVVSIPPADMRVFVRPQWEDLQRQYQQRGIQAIPVLTFLDYDFHEIGTWVERSRAANHYVEEWRQQHPEREAIRNDPSLGEDERREKLQAISRQYQTWMEDLYRRELQAATVEEIAALLAKAKV